MPIVTQPYVERELTAPVEECLADGQLNPDAVGWSCHPLHVCNLPDALTRKKKWNYWAVTDDRLLFSATIANMERAGTVGAYLYHRASGRYASLGGRCPAESIPMPQGIMGDLVIDQPGLRVELADAGAGTRIRVDAQEFGGLPLHADIVVERPPGHETLNVVIPWSATEFQFTSKQNTLPATGSIAWGDERFDLGAPAFGCLDYGRGIWPEHSIWNWGSASGIQAGHTVGFNLGGQWTDGTGMNENALCVDGRLTKISEDLRITYDRTDWMQPWRVRTAASQRIDLTFTPEFDRHEQTGRRDKYFTDVHQLFGRYRGRITPDEGGPIEVRDMFGWIEEHEARW